MTLGSSPPCSSFAVELGKAFFSSEAAKQQEADSSGAADGSAVAAAAAAAGGGGEPLPIQPGNMVWLIQRDFLKVK